MEKTQTDGHTDKPQKVGGGGGVKEASGTHPIDIVLNGDLKERGEVSDACMVDGGQHGQLGEVDMQRTTGCSHCQQLTVIGPLNPVQAALVLQRDDGIHLFELCQVMNLHAVWTKWNCLVSE